MNTVDLIVPRNFFPIKDFIPQTPYFFCNFTSGSESLVTFMTSKKVIEENYNNLEKMGIEWIDPWEKPLHEIYNSYPCLSPIPSLAVHYANINSIFGVSPFVNLKKLWDDNEN